jgi:hypothetical protein
MNPDVADAIGRLRAEGVLSETQAARLLRVSLRELVSVRLELRALLYAGVLLITSGIGLFIKEHHNRLGPAAIGTVVGLAAAACLFRVMKTAPPFSWGEVAAPDVAFDYVLLLGLLLLAADLTYLEVQVKLLGPNWPYHFLIVSVLYLLAAYRWDSRAVLALALTSFAAWRGVSVNVARGVLEPRTMEATRWNAIACGVLFLLGAVASVAWKKKAHFEGVWANIGLLLLLGALLSGVFGERDIWPFWLLALLLVASAVIWISFRLGRLLPFAMGVVAGYLGFLRLLFRTLRREEALAFLMTAISSIGVLVVLVAAFRRMKEKA